MSQLFAEPTPAPDGQTNEPDYLEYAKSKFADADGNIDLVALAKAKYHADMTIEQREREQAGLRDELKTRTSLDQLLEEIKASRVSNAPGDNQASQVATEDDKPKVTSEEIQEIIKQTLNQETQKATQQKNVDTVRQELTSKWGNDFHLKLKEVTKDLEMTEEEAGYMAANRPKAFLKLVLGTAPSAPVNYAPPASSVRIDNNKNTPGERTMSWYKKQYPGAAYWEPKVQNEIHAIAQRIGWDAFNK